MAVPKFHEMIDPVLRTIVDGVLWRLPDLVVQVADTLDVSDGDRKVLIPSGKNTRLYNRVSWATTYLRKAGALEKPSRGNIRITDRGRQLLDTYPDGIDLSILAQFDEFKQFKAKPPNSFDHAGSINDPNKAEVDTPEERIDQAMQEIQDSLAFELLEAILAASPSRFEQVVVDLLVAMGYGGSRTDAAQVIGGSGDGGIDGTIKEDRLGLDVVYVQAKRWQGPVGRKEIQSFAGSLEGVRASKGVFITTSSFTKNATEYVQQISKRIILIDGDRLTSLMIDHGVGVSAVISYTISRLDSDYLEDN